MLCYAHFTWVFTVCWSTHLGVTSILRVKNEFKRLPRLDPVFIINFFGSKTDNLSKIAIYKLFWAWTSVTKFDYIREETLSKTASLKKTKTSFSRPNYRLM